MPVQREALTAGDYARIAQSIRKISDVGRSLDASGLSKKAVVCLLHEATGLPKKDITLVLAGICDLTNWCLIGGA